MHNPDPDSRREHAFQARNRARAAAFQLARDAGAPLVSRRIYHGTDATTTDVESLAGALASRDLEYAARSTAREYVRLAREAGHSWEHIGQALGLEPNADTDQTGMTIAEAAYTYAAGSPYSDTAIGYGRSFSWHCRSCDQAISDRGLIAGPAEDEAGHAPGCLRLAAAAAQWDADWEPEP